MSRHARSAIRRARRNIDSRPFRRRAALLRDNFPTPGPESVARARYPWIESGHLPPPEAYVAPPPRTMPPTEADRGAPTPESTELRDALREMRNRAAERGPEASEARLISLFGERWAFENLPQPSRTSATPPAGEEQSGWQEPERPSHPRFPRAQLDRMSMVGSLVKLIDLNCRTNVQSSLPHRLLPGLTAVPTTWLPPDSLVEGSVWSRERYPRLCTSASVGYVLLDNPTNRLWLTASATATEA